MKTSRKVQNESNAEIILKSYWELHISNINKLIDEHADLSIFTHRSLFRGQNQKIGISEPFYSLEHSEINIFI
jgi:hypothetical protein